MKAFVSTIDIRPQTQLAMAARLGVETSPDDTFAVVAASILESVGNVYSRICCHLIFSKPESTEGRPWGQPLKKPSGAPLNLG